MAACGTAMPVITTDLPVQDETVPSQDQVGIFDHNE
jgi:hypothetical protein